MSKMYIDIDIDPSRSVFTCLASTSYIPLDLSIHPSVDLSSHMHMST